MTATGVLWTEEVIPEMSTADRMHYALRKSGVRSSDMAEFIGVSRSAVSQWTGGSVLPKIGTLRLWSMRTGFPLEWLTARLEIDQRERAECAARDSNPEPADYGSAGYGLAA